MMNRNAQAAAFAALAVSSLTAALVVGCTGVLNPALTWLVEAAGTIFTALFAYGVVETLATGR